MSADPPIRPPAYPPRLRGDDEPRDAPALLLTRPLALSRAFLAALGARSGGPLRVVISPLAEHRATGATIPPGTLVFTSGRAVEAAAAIAGTLEGRHAFAVGDRTAALARAAGAETVSAAGDVEALLALLLRASPQEPFVHLRGEHSRGDLAARLRREGRPASEVIVYRTVDLPLDRAALALLGGSAPVLAPVFSPRTGMLLARYPVRAPLHVVAISEAAARPFVGRCAVDIAARPDADAVSALVLRCLGNLP